MNISELLPLKVYPFFHKSNETTSISNCLDTDRLKACDCSSYISTFDIVYAL